MNRNKSTTFGVRRLVAAFLPGACSRRPGHRRILILLVSVIPIHFFPISAQATSPLAQTTSEGYAVPQPGWTFSAPRDHGSHPRFRIEWWYITGHLFSETGDRFGFQATFFRNALERPDTRKDDQAATDETFGSSQLHLAHMTLLEARTGRFIHEERLNRNGWDASAASDRLALRNGNWTLQMLDTATEAMALRGSILGEALFELTLVPEKPRVIFGENGVSRKGADATAASHYITFPRLATTGTVRIGQRELPVEGTAWMDHEISSSQLSANQTGWDWCSIQLDDGWDVMAYQLRQTDGSTDPFSTLAWISPSGEVTHVRADRFRWEPIETWTSPETGARYPVRYRLITWSPREEREVAFEVRPLALNQELTGNVGGIAYWEGACDVFDVTGNRIGRAYTELTGYAESLQGRF